MFVQDANDLTAHLAQLGDVLFRVGKLGFGIKVSLFIRHLEHVIKSARSRVPFQVEFYILLEADWGKSRFHSCAITLLAVLSKYQMVRGRQDSS